MGSVVNMPNIVFASGHHRIVSCTHTQSRLTQRPCVWQAIRTRATFAP